MPELTEDETTRRDDIVANLDQIKADIGNQAFVIEDGVAELNRLIESYRDGLQDLSSLHEEVVRRLADDDHDDLAQAVEYAAELNEPADVDVEQELRIDLCHADAIREIDTLLAAHAERVEEAEYA